jgi:adenine-specific DNA methylase
VSAASLEKLFPAKGQPTGLPRHHANEYDGSMPPSVFHRVKQLREQVKGLQKQYDKTEDDLKALQVRATRLEVRSFDVLLTPTVYMSERGTDHRRRASATG